MRNPRLKLIGITDLGAGGATELIRAAEEALAGGLPALMFRDKTLGEPEARAMAIELAGRARAAGALFLVNRRIELAAEIGADGAHVGAEGPTIEQARAALGAGAIVGYSAHSEEEALEALGRGADYVFFSPIFETPSKAGVLEPVGLERLAALARREPGRVIALGGIDEENIREVARTGAAGVAVIRAVFAAASPREAVGRLLVAWGTDGHGPTWTRTD